MIRVAQKKTVRSHSPDEKYNLLAGGGRSGQCGCGSVAAPGDWGRQVLILLILILILWRGGFHPAGYCARMPIRDASACDHDR